MFGRKDARRELFLHERRIGRRDVEARRAFNRILRAGGRRGAAPCLEKKEERRRKERSPPAPPSNANDIFDDGDERERTIETWKGVKAGKWFKHVQRIDIMSALKRKQMETASPALLLLFKKGWTFPLKEAIVETISIALVLVDADNESDERRGRAYGDYKAQLQELTTPDGFRKLMREWNKTFEKKIDEWPLPSASASAHPRR